MNKTEMKKVIVGCEPTGCYWLTFQKFLQDHDVQLVTVNPFTVNRSMELDDNSPEKSDLKDPKTIALNILVRQSRLTDFIRATVPVRESIRNVMPRKALYMSRHMIGYYAEANMPVGTRLPRCLEYICCGGSCQEHRGIMFLMAIWSGSALPEWWLSKSGQMAQK